MKVLMINGCIRGGESRSWKLAEAFLSEMRQNAPDEMEYEQLNLVDMDLKPLTGDFFEGRQKLLESPDRSHPRFDYAHQFANADYILIAAPFWDLGIPAIVKIYIENISVDGITFGCNENGMYGMSKAKKMLFFTTRGSVYGNGPLEQGARYLEALCEMFGIPQFQCIFAEGIDAMPERAEEIMQGAINEAKRAAQDFWR